MKHVSRISLAAVVALGMGGVAFAQDAGAGVGLDAGANAQVGVDAANPSLGADVDTMATGSISSHGNLVSSIQTTSDFDVSSYTADTTVNCVAVSSLQGNAQGNAQAIGNASSGNEGLATLRTDIQANTDLMTKLEASCNVAEFDVEDIVFVETGADGSLTFYYDDSAA